jgi:hypothetical protein
MTSEGTNPMSDLWTFDDEDGGLHCVGAGDADTVLRVLRVHAERYDCTAPGDDAEPQLRRGCFRELGTAENSDTQFVPCGSRDPRSVLITSWTPAKNGAGQ